VTSLDTFCLTAFLIGVPTLFWLAVRWGAPRKGGL